MEQDLGLAEAGQDRSEKAKHTSSNSRDLAEQQVSHLERRCKELQKQLQSTEKGQQLSAMYVEGMQKQKEELARLEKEKTELKAKADAAAKELQAIEKQRTEHEQKCVSSNGSAKTLASELRSMQQEVASLKAWQQQVKGDADVQMRGIADTFLPLSAQVDKMKSTHANLLERCKELDTEREKLRNLIQELQESIRLAELEKADKTKKPAKNGA